MTHRDVERCKGEAHTPGPGGGWFPCQYPAKFDGWCGVHHPDAVARREAKQRAKYEARETTEARRSARRGARFALAREALLLAGKLEEGSLVCFVRPDAPSPSADAALTAFLAAADKLREVCG